MTAHVVMVFKRHHDGQFVGTCTCGRRLESRDHDDVADYLQACRLAARTPIEKRSEATSSE